MERHQCGYFICAAKEIGRLSVHRLFTKADSGEDSENKIKTADLPL
jgi:hypothetical protein